MLDKIIKEISKQELHKIEVVIMEENDSDLFFSLQQAIRNTNLEFYWRIFFIKKLLAYS